MPSSNLSQKLALEHSTNRSRICRSQPAVYSTRHQKQASSVIASMKGQANAELPSSRIGIVLLTTGGIRVNSLSTLFEMNKRLLSNATFTLPSDPKDRSLIDSKAQISADSIIGSSTQISERVIIKKSAIGRHCKIGKQAKITNCILFNHCVIGEGARLDNCILGKNTKIGIMTELTRCVTQAGYEVMPGESIKNEKLEVSDWTSLAAFQAYGE